MPRQCKRFKTTVKIRQERNPCKFIRKRQRINDLTKVSSETPEKNHQSTPPLRDNLISEQGHLKANRNMYAIHIPIPSVILTFRRKHWNTLKPPSSHTKNQRIVTLKNLLVPTMLPDSAPDQPPIRFLWCQSPNN